MARIRNASSASVPRKRSRESTSPSRSSKRRQGLNLDTDAPKLAHPFSRETSPSKNVHWELGSRIISGPSSVDPQRRSQSPTRSALRRPLRENDHGESDDSEDEHHGPSAQLHEDLCRADDAPQPAKPSTKKTYDPKKLPPGVGYVYPLPGRKGAATKAKHAMKSSPDRSDFFNDKEMCEQIDSLKQQIAHFVDDFPPRPKKAKSDVLSHLLQPENEVLVRYIGCIAMGGGNGPEGWQELLTDNVSRHAVVWGVLGKAMKENVFDELYFGAWPELEAKLQHMEREQAQQDGFYRQRARSDETIKRAAALSHADKQTHLHRAAARVALGLEILLLPLWRLGAEAGTTASWLRKNKQNALFDLALSAAKTARAMRAARDVVYYWPRTLKDEEFEPARMECLNLGEMIRQSPYDRQEVNGRDRPILRDGCGDESQAIVRVVCFPGIQAFRQGGGELARSQLAAELGRMDADGAPPDVVAMRRRAVNRYGKPYTGNEGIRTRVISKGVVLLQWGNQRLLTKEAGTSVHVDAMRKGEMRKYEDNAAGRVELCPLFEERTASARASPTKAVQQQRSPSLMASITRPLMNLIGGGDDEEEDDDLPVANFHQLHHEREAAERRLASVPANPRSNKTSRS